MVKGMRKRGSLVASAIRSGAGGTVFDPRDRRGKFWYLNSLPFVSFAQIGALTRDPLCHIHKYAAERTLHQLSKRLLVGQFDKIIWVYK